MTKAFLQEGVVDKYV